MSIQQQQQRSTHVKQTENIARLVCLAFIRILASYSVIACYRANLSYLRCSPVDERTNQKHWGFPFLYYFVLRRFLCLALDTNIKPWNILMIKWISEQSGKNKNWLQFWNEKKNTKRKENAKDARTLMQIFGEKRNKKWKPVENANKRTTFTKQLLFHVRRFELYTPTCCFFFLLEFTPRKQYSAITIFLPFTIFECFFSSSLSLHFIASKSYWHSIYFPFPSIEQKKMYIHKIYKWIYYKLPLDVWL